MIQAKLVVRADARIGTISRRVYGHFAEHLGRCCYDGLWVGDNPHIPNMGGFRLDVINALKAMPVPMLRWPGGCYADHYHWRDGIGDPAQRPIRLGMSCGLQVEDDNALGTHEFMALCQAIGAEPYLAGNMGSGSVQELCDWLEYCNSTVRTSLVREREANGSAQPFGVKLWGVGNENWGCGGHYDASSYALEYRRYATMLRHVDSSAELVACGHEDEWNQKFFEVNARHLDLLDHFSIHRYWINGGPELNFTEEQYYRLLEEADETEDFVSRTAGYIRDTLGDKNHKIGIALDEWGVWHPEARPWGPDGAELARQPVTYEQAGTMRDAVAVAAALEGFHRQANVLSLANLAQIVNVLHAPVMTDGAAMWLTPTYYALQLHIPHLDATALSVDVSDSVEMPYTKRGTSAVTATASEKDGRIAVTVTNRHYSDSATVQLSVAASGVRAATVLSADDARAVNSADQPDRVGVQALSVSPDGAGVWRVELPPHAIATIEFEA